MAGTVQAKAIVVGAGAVGLGSLAWLAISLFALPEREGEHPALPPIVMPQPDRIAAGPTAGHAATDAPSSRTRERACGGAAGAIVQPPRPIGDPATWFSSDDYPWASMLRGHQGLTIVEIGVSEAGAVIACGVDASSGHFTLDRQTCSVFRTRARFEPARDDRGCPVASLWRKRVRWVLPPN